MLVTPGQKRLGERRAFFLITNRTSTGKPADKGGPPDTADHNNREPGHTRSIVNGGPVRAAASLQSIRKQPWGDSRTAPSEDANEPMPARPSR